MSFESEERDVRILRNQIIVALADGPIPICHVPLIATIVPQKPLHGMQVESMPRQEASGKMSTGRQR